MEQTYIINDLIKLSEVVRNVEALPRNGMFEVAIRTSSKKKTHHQRKYFHSILQEICKETGGNDGLSLKDAVENLKMEIKYRVVPLREVKYLDQVYLYPMSSEGLTTKQYADLITAALMYADAAGVNVSPPERFGYIL